ncbi:MAG: hydroxyacid dehydrogenase [Burkholderiaceae bacterium]
MPVIAYLNSFPAPVGLDILRDHGGHEVLRIDSNDNEIQAFESIARAHAWQCVGARDEVPPHFLVDSKFLNRAPKLLVASASGSGVDVFDLPACTQAGVVVVNQAGANAESVAEHALSMMINLLKQISNADRALRRGWQGARLDFTGRDLLGRTVGIIGFGNIGRRVAQICQLAFRCEVIAYDPNLTEEQIGQHCARKVEFDELLAQADIVTIHTPLTPDTRGLMNAAAFASMRPDAIFISTARGSIHDEEALADALVSGHLGGAGLDVWEKEPPQSAHRLLQLDNVIATPHVAGATTDSLDNMASYAATQLLDILSGKPPARVVNPDALPKFEARRNQLL